MNKSNIIIIYFVNFICFRKIPGLILLIILKKFKYKLFLLYIKVFSSVLDYKFVIRNL